ncbi:MAG TPA: YlcI/YnfO family protein, partial [Candidatus Contendobacter sp.]|nr:YlcI/YnfO family protein [Candidatus Contendobacter sp.]
MRTATAKQERIGARVPHEVYETLCRAAELTGATVNQFLVQSALKEAQA